MSTGIVTDLRPPESSSAIVRKLGAMTLLSEMEISFLESLQINRIQVEDQVDFIQDGQDLKATFIVTSGWAIRYLLTEDGRRQILSFALPGDILGLHINFQRKSTYNAAGIHDLELAVIDPLRTIEVSQKYPVLSAGFSWCTAREFAILGDQALRLGRLSAFKKLCHLLLELWHRLRLINETDGPWFELPLRQIDLADALGLSNVHINRQLQDMRRAGLITQQKNWIKIEEVEKMIEIAEFDTSHLAEFRI
ncbi:Crp/Fnr family transcriptional regulator [Aestuariibius sp. 2305UL40-4]|uniref:Crp/Fnr family transcriptional regulator n=1 Tax=Aestuariibius violaceus TaxID=3234132 RepID=UPI00345E8AB8